MSKDEFKHIDLLIELIQKKLNWEVDRQLSQRDFEFLIETVFIKTQTRISLSTIKRIWYHNNKYLPRVSTLDILCQFLDYSSWSHFKVASMKGGNISQPRARLLKGHLSNKHRLVLGILIIVSMIIIFLSLFTDVFNKVDNYSDTKFEISKQVGEKVPVTVVFSYDISQIEFDSAFIQLSWNKLERHRLSRDENTLTSMYYIPGIHEAKLIINDSIVKRRPVYIENSNWLTLFRNEPEEIVPIYIESDEVFNDSFIHASSHLLNDFKADTTQDSYYVSYLISKELGVIGDDFTFETRIKNSTVGGKFYCQYSSIYIYGEKGGVFLTLNQPGCVGSTGIVIGDKTISGRKNDLSELGKDFSNWQVIKGIIHDHKFDLLINDTLVHQTEYSSNIGKILTWQYFFMGNGAVDYLRLWDEEQEQVLNEEY